MRKDKQTIRRHLMNNYSSYSKLAYGVNGVSIADQLVDKFGISYKMACEIAQDVSLMKSLMY